MSDKHEPTPGAVPQSIEQDFNKSNNRLIRRITWLDLYPIKDEEAKVLGEKFNQLREDISTTPTTASLVRRLNQTAFDKSTSSKERLAWLKIKDWIFDREVMNRDKALSDIVNPDEIEKWQIKERDKLRKRDDPDDWTGTQRGIYTHQLFPSPISILDYSVTQEQIKDEVKFRKLNPTEMPGNFENFIVERLNEIKKLKDGPVVFIDFGGVQSVTTLRLAKKYSREVEQGQMVFIVTNLGADRGKVETYIKNGNYRGEEGWLLEAMKWVHYVQADAEELKLMEINLPDGTRFKLDKNVDFIHEAHAISAHGMMNDRDFTILGGMLSKYGLVATRRHVVNLGVGLDSETGQKTKTIRQRDFVVQKGYKGKIEDYPAQRKPVILLDWDIAKKARAYKNLTEDLGLVNIDSVPLSNGRAINLGYSFFVSPTAPDLKFTDRFNHEYLVRLTSEARSSNLNPYSYDEHREGWEKEGK